VIVGEDAAVDAGHSDEGNVVWVHAIVDASAACVVVAPRNAGLEVYESRVGPRPRELVERIAPDVGKIDRTGDRAVGPLGQVHVGLGTPDVILVDVRIIAGVREHLVDTPAGHHVAAEEKPDMRVG